MVESSRALLVLGQTPFPIELLDRDCRVLYCNLAYVATFLDKPSDVLDRPSRVLPARLGDKSRAELLVAVERDGPWKGEVMLRTADNTELPARLCIFAAHEKDAPAEFAVIYEDITTEVEAREALAHQRNLVAIRSRQAQMGELLSLIAHQWRQPLTVVMSLIGNVQLRSQLGQLEPEYLKTKLDRVAEAVQFLSETIDTFRGFHTSSKHKTEEDLASLARKAVDLVLPALEKIGVAVDFPVSPEVVSAPVYRSEFQQLVLELVNNAREALTEGGRVRIELRREGSEVVLHFGYNGAPIPEKLQSQIFDPYYTTKDGLGVSLGLYMAKTIVEAHHDGTLSMSSTAEWTSFTAAFPVGP